MVKPLNASDQIWQVSGFHQLGVGEGLVNVCLSKTFLPLGLRLRNLSETFNSLCCGLVF